MSSSRWMPTGTGTRRQESTADATAATTVEVNVESHAELSDASPSGQEPLPLMPRRELPPFPIGALPPVIGEMVTAVATATQTDLGMAGSVALGSLAACAGGRVMVEIRAGWREPLNLYLVTVAGPGERKSAVLRKLTAPLQLAERSLVEAGHVARLEAQTTKDIAARAAEVAKASAGKADEVQRQELLDRAIAAASAAQSVEIPPLPRLLADDVTPEACATLLAEQGGRLAVISAEGGIFDIIAGRYSGNVPVLDIWLKGHSGDPLRVDRKGRDSEYVEHPALTLCLMIQPNVLNAMARQQAFRGRGLLARFLYCMPESQVGHRTINPQPVSPEVEGAYSELVQSLAAGLAEWRDPAVIVLDGPAAQLIVDFEHCVEPQLAAAGDLRHIADWGSKYVGAVARIAGLLHLADHPSDGFRRPVTAETVSKAIQLGEYYRAHAVAAFEEMRTDPEVHAAEYLLEVIRRLGTEVVSRRDLHRSSSRSRFPRAQDLEPATRLLEEHGHLRRLSEDGVRRGRPRSPRWEVHPSLIQDET